MCDLHASGGLCFSLCSPPVHQYCREVQKHTQSIQPVSRGAVEGLRGKMLAELGGRLVVLGNLCLDMCIGFGSAVKKLQYWSLYRRC